MKEDNIVQFICFVTRLEYDDFISNWEPFTKENLRKEDPLLQEAISLKGKKKYRYVSQHRCKASAFKFFNQGRSHDFLPEHIARIVSAGGYTLTPFHKPGTSSIDEVKVIAFLGKDEMSLDFYKDQRFHLLNIYSAYFESCNFSYILEYFLSEEDAPELVELLNKKNGVEAAIYKECSILHS